MKIRSFKIAVSAASVVACLLLAVLWVRSYRGVDVVYRASSTSTLAVFSERGVIGASKTYFEGPPKWAWLRIEIMPGPVQSWYFHSGTDGTSLRFPIRLPIAVLILLTVVPWIRRRYSLRAVLIAITVVALLLGLLLYPGCGMLSRLGG